MFIGSRNKDGRACEAGKASPNGEKGMRMRRPGAGRLMAFCPQGQGKRPEHFWRRGRVLLPVLLLFGGIMAFDVQGFGAGAGSALNQFTLGSLDITLEEEGFVADTLAVPGMRIPKAPLVKNTGEVEAVVFMEVEIPRARLYTVSGFEKQEESLSELFSFTSQEGWTLMSRRETEQAAIYLYAYDQTLPAGASTPPLFEELVTISYLEGSFADGQQAHVWVRARAIQAQAAQATREETYELYLRDEQG